MPEKLGVGWLGDGWVAHKILVTALSPNFSFPFGLDLGLGLGLVNWWGEITDGQAEQRGPLRPLKLLFCER